MSRWIGIIMCAALAAGCSRGKADVASDGATAEPAATTVANVAPEHRSGLLPQSRPLLSDVPEPAGFAIVEAVSRKYDSPLGRYADLIYEGRADKAAVDRFYRNQMPAAGWKLRHGQMVRGTFELHFEKGNEDAMIRISDAQRRTSRATQVEIDLHPVQR